MRNDMQRSGGDGGAVVPLSGKGNNGIIPNSFKAISSYLRIVSSGASSVASTVKSAASAIVERDSEASHEQVSWAGFDKVELEEGVTRQVLLLGYSYGFQVWDVEVANDVHNLVSRHDGPVSFMQMSPTPAVFNRDEDKFAESRPLLIICADGTFSGGNAVQDGSAISFNTSIQQSNGPLKIASVPTVVWFYSLRSQSYVHLLRFRSAVYLVRCSSRVVAVLQLTQIHCFNAAKLEREYTILTNPVVTGCYGAGNIGFGPLAVGPRWMAYSGSQVMTSDSGCLSSQQLSSSASFSNFASNGNCVAHYAKESSKQIASGFVTLGDMGYKKLSRYYSGISPEGKTCQSGAARVNIPGSINEHLPDVDDIGMVIVRDIVSKTVIAQFRAHKSPILSLCFDPSGTLLVTASVQGHNINVFRIMPGPSEGSSRFSHGPSYVHLYRLQRGFTNAIIQDISFSMDSLWIMISSSRGTSHLFSLSASGDCSVSTDACFSARNTASSSMTKPAVHGLPNSGLQVLTQQIICTSGSPVTLSAVSRIRNGNHGWRNAVSGAATAATGRVSSLSGAIASAFHNCKGNDTSTVSSTLKKYHYLLVFSPSGSMIQYAMQLSSAYSGVATSPGARATYESGLDYDARLVVEAIQKWNICQKQNRKEREDKIDLCGESGNSSSSKVHPERSKLGNGVVSDVMCTTMKDKTVTEERHNIFISEAELQMHQNQNPLWARSEICFQSMLSNAYNMEEDCASGGEIEIEKIPICMLEARSKDLVPVYDYLQAPKFQQERMPVTNHGNNGQFIHQFSDVSEDVKLTFGTGSCSLDFIANGGIVGHQSDNGADETGQTGPHFSIDTSRGFVNTDNTPVVNTRLNTIKTRENCVKASQIAEIDEFG